ncbi:energy transducer TonB [Flavobacterium litorale]|uniref:Energy transducer TonB n=1 Tax=Flavobacterium litorale TaxID=2856519 RepID=A0ABX8V759_9FLAO|nr:energy transducer TonB [Flavobacterium litorale]QYJ68327.1 energy transducer TonB [Flavobacterium litorale]
MSKANVFKQGWIDLVFEGRNKAYGAYKLRQEESKTTLIALFSGIGLILGLVSIPVIANHYNKEQAVVASDTETILVAPSIIKERIILPEPPKPKIEEPKPEKKVAPPKTKQTKQPTIKLKPIVATSTKTTVLPTTEDILKTQTAAVTSKGDGSGGFTIGTSSPTGSPDGKGTVATSGNGDGTVITALLDESPEFPGGLEKFYKIVGRKFNAPQLDQEMQLRVYVSFVVEKDGTLTGIKVIRDPGYGAGKEAIRVLKSIETKWKPGKMKGVPVRTAYNLPITVNIK